MRCSSQSLEGTWLAPLTASSYPVEMGFDTLFEIQEFNLDRFVESKIEPATGILLAFTPTGKFVICFGYEREVWDNPVRPGESGMTSIESDCEPDDLQMKWNLVHRDMLRLNCYKYGTDTLFKELVYKVNHTSDSTLNLSRIK